MRLIDADALIKKIPVGLSFTDVTDSDTYNSTVDLSVEDFKKMVRAAPTLGGMPRWIKTSERIPSEYDDGEQVFTLPITLGGGQADLTWTHHVGDDPERYPYWMPLDSVLDWLTNKPSE